MIIGLMHVAIRMHELYDVDTIRIMNDKWISNSDYIINMIIE